MDEKSPLLLFIIVLIYIIATLLFLPAFKKPNIKRPFSVFGFLFILFFCLFAIYDGDYFSYKDIYGWLLTGHSKHMEDVYAEIAQISPTYTIFRIYIWGTALLVFYLFTKRLKLNSNLCFFFLCSMFLPLFAYGRVSFGFAVAFLGISFLIKPMRNRFVSYIIGLALLFGSMFLHKSMPLIIPALLAVFLLRILPKYTIIIVCVCIPVLSLFFQTYIIPYMFSFVGSDSTELAVNTMNQYMSQDETVFSLGYTLKKMLEYFTYYFSAFLAVLFLIKNRNNKTVPQEIISIAFLIFSITILAILFLLNKNGNTYVFFYRQLNFMMIPICAFLSYCYMIKWKPKLIKFNLCLGIMSAMYWLVYSCYASL